MVIFILIQLNHIFVIFIIMTTITLFKHCSGKYALRHLILHGGKQSCSEA